MPPVVQSLEIDKIREFTRATKNDDGTFSYYQNKTDFRFFRYTPEYPTEEDYGNTLGEPGGPATDIKISGIQLQTVAQCLVNFFNYSPADVSFSSELYSLDSVSNSKYKSISKLSKTIGEIQSGRGTGVIKAVSKYLKLEIIKRYNPKFAKNKTDLQILNSKVKLEDVAKEQIGVVGPVTYNFIIRQAIFQWFKKEYLSNPDSFLSKSLPTVNTSWSSYPVDENLKYSVFVSDEGNPSSKPYPTLCVVFSNSKDSDISLIARASQIVDFLLLRNTNELVGKSIYKIITDNSTTNENTPVKKCVYVDLAEVLFSPYEAPNLATIDMIKAGVSYLQAYSPAKFTSGNGMDTVESIKNSINYPSQVWNGLENFIDESAFYFTKPPKPDMQKMLIDDAGFFEVTNKSDDIYTKQYNLLLNDLLGAHDLYTNELADRFRSERQIRKNIFLRNYPASPFNENVYFYYDKNYNLLAGAIEKITNTAEVAEVPENTSICITKQNNPNLTIPDIEGEISLLEYLSEAQIQYKKLNNQTIIFITEFFIREYAVPSEQYSDNQELYDKIKSDIKKDLANNTNPKVKNQLNQIPAKSDVFLNGNYERVKVDYLYSYNEKSLLQKVVNDTDVVQTQLVKLKTSNFWTHLNNEIPNAAKTLDGFLLKHYPWLEHKPDEEKKKEPEPPPPPTGDDTPPPPGKKDLKTNTIIQPPIPIVAFERLKTEKLSIPNEIDLSTNLKIDDLLTGGCFTELIALLSNLPVVGKLSTELIDILDKVFSILNSIDFCYIADLILSKAVAFIEELINDPSTNPEVKQSIQDSLTDIKECLPQNPTPSKLKDTVENPSDTFRIACLTIYQNLPKLPYFISLDFLQILKRVFFEFLVQVVLELIIQSLNALIKGLADLCKSPNNTASALITNTSQASQQPVLPSPEDEMNDELSKKCAIVELLSSNPNINKIQIYNVVRQYFGYTEITNLDFDLFFGNLTSALYTQDIIDLFTDSIDQTLYGTILNFADPEIYPKFQKILFNISTTRSFFRFLGKYINLAPCYEKTAQDRTKAAYCYDPKNPLADKNLSDQQLLDVANDLLKQITDVCAALSGQNFEDRFTTPSLLNEQAKEAIAAGAYAIIDAASGNFNQMKKSFFNSYSTIQVFNSSINNKSFSSLNNVTSKDFKLISSDDALIRKIATLSGESKAVVLNEYGDTYFKSALLEKEPAAVPGQEDLLSILISFDAPDNSLGIQDGNEEFIFNKASLLKEETRDILPPVPKIIKNTKTVLTRIDLTEAVEFTAEQFINIFFDDKRFSKSLKNKNPALARKEKNYYYLYNNFLNDVQGNSGIESLKRYIDVKNELENFLK